MEAADIVGFFVFNGWIDRSSAYSSAGVGVN